MKKTIRMLSLMLAVCLLLPMLFACAQTPAEPNVPAFVTEPDDINPTQPENRPNVPDELKTPEIIAPPPPAFTDPLTGLGSEVDLAGKRPIVVSINNHPDSLPQSGIQSAGIIYEVLAEGGITRLIGVFSDAEKLPTIGSVRSTRPYIVDIATGYDPLFVHFGGSVDGYAQITKNKIMALDGIAYDGTYFYRDKERIKNKVPYEHTAFTNAELILKADEKLKAVDLTRDPAECEPAYDFSDEAVKPDAQKADTVKINFSAFNSKSTFTYDAAKGIYTKMEYGKDHLDIATGKALEVKNVFVLKIPSKAIDNVGRRLMNTAGSGEGWYITNGGGVKITWSRKDIHSQFTYTTADGKPLKVNPGNSYVSIVNDLDGVTFPD